MVDLIFCGTAVTLTPLIPNSNQKKRRSRAAFLLLRYFGLAYLLETNSG